MKIKRIICLLLSIVMVLGILAGCQGDASVTTDSNQNSALQQTQEPTSQDTTESDVTEPIVGEYSELAKAQELGIIPAEWDEDLSVTADFTGFHQMMTSLITLCDETALSAWQENVDPAAFPQQNMYRDDALILLLLAAEPLGYNVYNARSYVFCIENLVDYDTIFSQLSWDYPYCNTQREILLYYGPEKLEGEPFDNVATAAVFWMQRRMDVYNRVHFLEYDENLDFHLDQPLTREDAIAAAVRLYNSEMLEYDPTLSQRVPTEEDEKLLAAAEARKQEILSNTDTLECEKTAYYVSNDGDDANDGLTPQTAWATLSKVNGASLQRGDGVYFERGGLWRGQLWAQEGVIYSAYGEGEKPKIYASPENGADPAKWSLLEGTDNIWVYYMDMRDCGALVFDNDESFAVKVAPRYVNGYLSTINEGEPFDVRTELSEDLMFFSEADSVLYNGVPFSYEVMDGCDRNEYPDVVGTLYLRCDKGNPGEVFNSIEFMVRDNIVIPELDTVFNNLCLKYTGFHGIYGYSGFDVSFCEIGWIGGSPQFYDENGIPVCAGNAVECGGNYDHFSVTDCYIYQCYDAGVSHQFSSSEGALMQNITYARNVITHTDAAVEVFYYPETCKAENVLIADNYFLYSGYGWFMGILGKDNYWGAAYQGHNYPNVAENFRMENNVFYLSTGPLISTAAAKEHRPVMSGNTYVQHPGGILAQWPMGDEYDESNVMMYPYSDKAADYVRDILGDENGIVPGN